MKEEEERDSLLVLPSLLPELDSMSRDLEGKKSVFENFWFRIIQ